MTIQPTKSIRGTAPFSRRVGSALSAAALFAASALAGPLHAQVCPGDVALTTQAEVDAFACTSVTGSLIISGVDITDLAPLAGLEEVESLTIADNTVLQTLEGLGGAVVEDDVQITDNPALMEIGSVGLSFVEGSVAIRNNGSLTSLDGIGLGFVGGGVTIENNDELPSLYGMESLGGVGTFGSGVVLRIAGNARLRECSCGLSGMIEDGAFTLNGGDVEIADNDPNGICTSPAAVLAAPCATCTTDAPLSFDFDGDGVQEGEGGGAVEAEDFNVLGTDPAYGEFAAVRDESATRPVDLSTCSFVVFDPFDEDVTFAAQTAGSVEPEGTYVLATGGGDQLFGQSDVLPDGPGAFALVTGMAAEGEDVLAFVVPSGVSRIVAAAVYDADRAVLGSVKGGATEAQMDAFLSAMAEAFGGATAGEGAAASEFSVAVVPNPSSGRAWIAFTLARATDVRVAVYDVLGREVAVLAEGPRGPGLHEAALGAGVLAPGAYVVRAVAGAEVRTVQFTVVR